MQPAPIPVNEKERLFSLHQLNILDTPPEERFDRITRLATKIFKVPISTLTLIDSNREWFKSCQGLDKREGERAISFCGHAMLADNIFIIPDALKDPRFSDNPLVKGEPFIRFYAGVSLKGPEGYRVGTFCIKDHQPRMMSEDEIKMLEDLAAWAELELNVHELGRALSAREKAEKELEEKARALKEEKVRDEAFLRSIGEGVVVTDQDGRVILINHVVSQIIGYGQREITGKVWAQELPQVEDSQGRHVSYEETPVYLALHNQGTNSKKYWYVGKNNQRIPVIITGSPVVIEGKNQGAIVVFRDVSKEEQIDKMKDEFLSIASHEMRTPLTVIKGVVSMILEGDYGELNDKLKPPLSDVAASTERLTVLVGDMLNVSRLESGKLKFNLQTVDLKVVIEDVVKTLQPLVKDKNIKLAAGQLSSDPVQADQDKLRVVLNNLLGNAIKFTDYGNVVISSKPDGEKLEIEVSDSGIGIAKEDQDKLFGRFAQINTGEGRPQGTGLGLYISREFIRKMGGDLYLKYSERGKGSTFVFSLPVAGSKEAEEIKNSMLI